jgi:hypothetical protein
VVRTLSELRAICLNASNLCGGTFVCLNLCCGRTSVLELCMTCDENVVYDGCWDHALSPKVLQEETVSVEAVCT